MAPLKGEGVGWERRPHLSLANYGCRLSRGYAPCLRQPITQEWKKLPGFNPAECHHTQYLSPRYRLWARWETLV